MKITYTARNVKLRDNFKERVEKKLQKFNKLFSEEAAAYVVVTLEKNRQTVEITIRDKAIVYRAENTQPEMNDALDRVIEILTRQIRKNKTKIEKRLRSGAFETPADAGADPEPEETYELIRRKRFALKPMAVEEAILQMNMLNHAFYAFKNAEDENRYSVVYRRNDGGYGLIESD